MEAWQLHTLSETNETTGQRTQIGGAMIQMKIGAVNGPLHEIKVTPASVEEMQEEWWDSQFVWLQVADRRIGLEPDELQALVELLKMAHNASLRYFDRSHSGGIRSATTET